MTENRDDRREPWLSGAPDAELDREILEDPQLAEDIYADLEIREALSEAAQRPRVFPLPRPVAWAGGLIAAVLALFMILPEFSGDGDDLSLNLRTGQTGDLPVALAPADTVTVFPRSFTWHRGDRSEGIRYRWELYDSQARQRGIAVVQDTMLVRSGSDTPADSSGTWRWFVVELRPDGQEGATSKAQTFTVLP